MDKIECKICGFIGSNLSAHLKVHNISVAEYKTKYNVTTIISKSCSNKLKAGQIDTCLKNYGVEYNFQIPAVVEKCKNNMRAKCNGKGWMSLPERQEKAKKTRLKRFGCESSFQRKEVREAFQNKMQEKYGVKSLFQLPERQAEFQAKARISLNKKMTSLEEKVLNLVPSNVEYVGNKGFVITCKDRSGKIKHRCPDFIVHPVIDRKVIEVFGSYWHRNDNEAEVLLEYASYGYKCLIIWEKDLQDLEKVRSKVLIFCNPSETTRLAPVINLQDDDIVRSA